MIENITLRKAYDLFLFNLESWCGDVTVVNYSNNLRYFIDYLEKHYQSPADEIYVHEIDIHDLNGFSIYLKTKIKNTGHSFSVLDNDSFISDRTRKTYLICMRAFFNYLHAKGFLDVNPCKRFKMPRIGNKIIDPLTNDEVSKIDALFNINLSSGCRNLAVFHCLLDEGMRTGEVINLKLADVNFIEDYIIICLNKGKKCRKLPLSSVTKKYLKCYIEERRPDAPHPYIFCVEDGGQLTQDSIKSVFQRMRASTGLKRVYPHLLRDTFGVSYMLGGGSLETLRVLIGHSDIKTTEKYLRIAKELEFTKNIYQLDDVFFKKFC